MFKNLLVYEMVFSENRRIYISAVLFLVDVEAPVMLQELQVSSLRDAVSSTCNLVSQSYVFKNFNFVACSCYGGVSLLILLNTCSEIDG